MIRYFDFEKPIEQLDIKISKLTDINTEESIIKINTYNLEKKNLYKKIYSNLSAWQKVQIARHPSRPHCLDYINSIFDNFILLAGDKKFGEDKAIVSGMGNIGEQSL